MRFISVKPQNRSVKLLIVEENGAMCRLLRALVEGLAVAISECHDGSQVLAVCEQMQPDWILIDLDLTGMDVFAAARQISNAHRGARVLLLSEDDDARVREMAAGAGIGRHPKRRKSMTRTQVHRLSAMAAGLLFGAAPGSAQVVSWGNPATTADPATFWRSNS